MTNLKRHAYLVMAHHQLALLKKLISLLDDPRNDIYLHIDKRSSIEYESLLGLTQFAKLYFVNRTAVAWGGTSQIKVELDLLEAAVRESSYDYYHLLSGACLPIKSQDYIHDFFAKNSGFEFLRQDKQAMAHDYFLERIKYYYFFQELEGRAGALIYKGLNKLSLLLQKIIGVNRIRGSQNVFSKGTSWFSITDLFARHLVKKKEVILKNYRFTHCADEVFIHSEAISFFPELRLHESNYRLIDWARGKPYVFRNSDLVGLLSSECLYARKFNQDVDSEVIENIITALSHNNIC